MTSIKRICDTFRRLMRADSSDKGRHSENLTTEPTPYTPPWMKQSPYIGQEMVPPPVKDSQEQREQIYR